MGLHRTRDNSNEDNLDKTALCVLALHEHVKDKGVVTHERVFGSTQKKSSIHEHSLWIYFNKSKEVNNRLSADASLLIVKIIINYPHTIKRDRR